MSGRIRWGTDLITFANTTYWGYGPDFGHDQWLVAFDQNPKAYFEAMFDIAAEIGLEGIELAPAPGDWQRALSAFGDVETLRGALRSRGLELTSSYSPGMLVGHSLAEPEKWPEVDRFMDEHAAFVAAMGADTIVMGNVPRSRFGYDSPDDTAREEDFSRAVSRETHERYADRMNILGGIVGRHGVRIAIHTDAYSICSRPDDIATVLSLTDPRTVQLCPDSGHIAVDGGDPVAVLAAHIDRIPTMHWKDCAGPCAGHLLRGTPKERHATVVRNFRVLGAGNVDWESWMHVLRDAEWSGWANEEIDSTPEPVADLTQGLDYFRQRLAPIYS